MDIGKQVVGEGRGDAEEKDQQPHDQGRLAPRPFLLVAVISHDYLQERDARGERGKDQQQEEEDGDDGPSRHLAEDDREGLEDQSRPGGRFHAEGKNNREDGNPRKERHASIHDRNGEGDVREVGPFVGVTAVGEHCPHPQGEGEKSVAHGFQHGGSIELLPVGSEEERQGLGTAGGEEPPHRQADEDQ